VDMDFVMEFSKTFGDLLPVNIKTGISSADWVTPTCFTK
jgi:hypothetical protein